MDSDKIYSMYSEVVNGVDKSKSRFVKDDESSRIWDEIAEEVDDIRRRNPEAEFDVPSEIP